MGCSKILNLSPSIATCLGFYWDMQQTGNADRIDTIRALHWAALSSTIDNSGLFGNGVLLNTGASEGGLNGPNHSELAWVDAASGGVTFWYWIKKTANSDNSTTQAPVFIQWFDSVRSETAYFQFNWVPQGGTPTISLQHNDSITGLVSTSAPFNPNIGEWHLICGTWNKFLRTLNLYIDNALVSSVTDNTVQGGMNTGFMKASNISTGSSAFAYIIDEVGLSLTGAITLAQVQSIWNSGVGVTQPGIYSAVPTCTSPVGVFGTLSQLTWRIPGNCNPGSIYAGPAPNPPDQVETLSGTPGALFNVTLRIRGIVEGKTYSGGSVLNSWVNRDGTPAADNYNIYSLITSNPAHTYYLNNGPSVYPPMVLDYQITIPISQGSTVTLHADTIDGAEVCNGGGQVITPGPGDPPIVVPQPYYGQFLQMDVISVV